MASPIERQRAYVDGLPRLINGLFSGQKYGDFVFEANRLSEFG